MPSGARNPCRLDNLTVKNRFIRAIEFLRAFPVIAIPRCARDFRNSSGSSKQLFLNRYSQRLHFPIKMTSFEAKHFRRAADVAVVFVEFLEDIVALISGACLVKRGKA